MWTRPLRRLFSIPSRTQCTPVRSERVPYQYRGSFSQPRIPHSNMPLSHKFMNDQILIDSLRLKCTCGPDAFGRPKPQPVLLSVRLGTLIARAAVSDSVELSVDYSALSKQLMKLENRAFDSAADMIDEVAEMALQNNDVGKVFVESCLEKGVLRAKNARIERVVWMDQGTKVGSWKFAIAGVDIPIIIGIEENQHERTQKQLVSIDLIWQSTEALPRSFPLMVKLLDPLLAKVAETSYQSLESLATFIAEEALDAHVENITVTVRKPSALPFAAASGVTITRYRHKSDFQEDKEVFIALGSNLGDRKETLERALKLLQASGVRIQDVSGLYESEPMYVEQQPQFLNAVCKARTSLSSQDLLSALKRIEVELGRLPSIRNGPRTLDLDILLYGNDIVNDNNLIIPHLSMLERGFVLQPLADVAPNLIHPITSQSIRTHLSALPPPTQRNYISLPSSQLNLDVSHHRKPTLVMAILNLTPDSFSDGGKHSLKPTEVVEAVRRMIANGAKIIDIGGQSSRPNAPEITAEEEMERIVPAIKAIRQADISIPISIDTYRAKVAEAAILAGANIINDVSGGTLDPDMLSTTAKVNVPIILMHMRGTPQTMNSLAKYDGDLIEIIGRELSERVEASIGAGIRRWNIILDPGLGFAKTSKHNIEIMRRLGELRAQPALSGMPWLVGPSRKRFIEGITGEKVAGERLWGTAGAVAACVKEGADIVRVHDVAEMTKVVKMCDAIWRGV